MPSFISDLQLLSQKLSIRRRLSTGCQRQPKLQTCLPDGNTWEWWNTKSTPTPFSRKAYSIRIASPSLAPPHTGVPTTAPPSDKGHFVLPLLEDPDSKCRAQIPFPIDLAASCNTLLSCHLSSMPWAKILQSKTVILPYASPPIKPISQVTLQASKGKSTSNLTLQVINNDQPALLSTEASIALGALTLHVDFIRKYFTSNPSQPLRTEPASHHESETGPLPPPPDTSMRVWPTLGTWTLKSISENWTSLF